MLNVKKADYKSFGNSLLIDNGVVKLVIPLEFGIRILNYSQIDGENLFCETPDYTVPVGGRRWKLYGGHRIWYSPEENPRSYTFDEDPVEYAIDGDAVVLRQAPDKSAGMQKEMSIRLYPGSTKVRLDHKIYNQNMWDVQFSLWCLTVMAAGGVEVIPFRAPDTGLLHNRQISVWPMTDMRDERVYWGNDYITLKQMPHLERNFKLGINNTNGWAAYINHNQMFVKKFSYDPEALYPDNNVSFETYTCDFMTEIESLSPLAAVKPGGCIEHRETWEIFENVGLSQSDDEAEIHAIEDRYLHA